MSSPPFPAAAEPAARPARILLAWEIGANRGHVAKLGAVARCLLERGHRLSFAVQQPDALRAFRAVAAASEIRQAPIWPGLLGHAGWGTGGAATYGDLLADLGMADSGVLEYLLRAWDRLLADAAPDLVIAEFAPAALLAARGRLPTIALGTGYTVPPAHLPRFPVFHPDATAPVFDEEALLQVVNHALRRLLRAPLDRLPRLAEADIACPAVFAELDPYAVQRLAPPVSPFFDGAPGSAGAGQGVFAYVPRGRAGTLPLVEALALLAERGVPVAAFLPGLARPEAARLVAAGIALHEKPVPPAAIAARAALLVTLGGLGLLSAALAAGLPMVLLPTDVEKRLNAAAAARLGVADVPEMTGETTAAALADRLQAALGDGAMTARARALAPDFTGRLADSAGIVAAHATALIS
ncbi:hypothetical protein [Falsiroseomonas oryzae]|uniref:hypothetical protein n=1 Tax=Falsiroseomonas oryzae TaxID=2766473 RepID=UPI0022EB91AC|nr:hypothetical protein [Roseomonas sp. MO-31]